MADQPPRQKLTLRWLLGASATVIAIAVVGHLVQAPSWATLLAAFLAFAAYGLITRKNWRRSSDEN